MQRSIGVTLSAVVVFIGCGVAVLAAVGLAFFSNVTPSQVLTMPLMRAVLIIEILVDLAFVAWGISSGIGLLQLRPWARISMIVYSGLMISFCVIPMAIFLFVPIPRVEGVTANFGMMVRGFLELFYGFFVALGAFWIYFFNKRSTKVQFAPTTASKRAIGEQAAAPGAEPQPKKPAPIVVLGVLFLLSACFLPIALKMHTPLFFFGSFVHGSTDTVFILALLVLNLAAGIGLLRLQLWGWRLALFLSAFNVLNTAFLVLMPGAVDRMNQAMIGQYASMGMPDVAVQYPFASIARASLLVGVAIAAAFLWILMAYRRAFERAAPPAI